MAQSIRDKGAGSFQGPGVDDDALGGADLIGSQVRVAEKLQKRAHRRRRGLDECQRDERGTFALPQIITYRFPG